MKEDSILTPEYRDKLALLLWSMRHDRTCNRCGCQFNPRELGKSCPSCGSDSVRFERGMRFKIPIPR